MNAHTWQRDILGEGFEQLTLPLGRDDEGAVEATLVRHLPGLLVGGRKRVPFRDVDVLFIHGWSDYFFNRRLARFWAERGAHFYALDLRKYGRSLREGQTPGYIADLTDYDADIAAAFEGMGRASTGEGSRRLVLMGHSTGGLVLSLWAGRHPGIATALLLNSPWLEFQLTSVARTAISPVLDLQARIRPRDTWPQFDLGFYTRVQSLVADPLDVMEPNAAWRPERSMTVRVGWMRAIMAGHEKVERGLGIDAQIGVLLSQRSVLATRWSDAMTRADTVLNVDDIARAALKLGSSVTVERIADAIHDVFMSGHDARDTAYARMDRWARGVLLR